MSRRIAMLAVVLFASAIVTTADAQALLETLPTSQPIVTITASATSDVANDRMHALLHAEADNPDAVQAANDVNARMARALARAKAVTGVDASTTAYTSYQISEPNRPMRWRVSQSLALESSDFAARGFGTAGYRTGRVTIQTNDYGRPQPMLKSGMAAASAAPVTVEGGTSEVTVTVSGEAILDRVAPAPR